MMDFLKGMFSILSLVMCFSGVAFLFNQALKIDMLVLKFFSELSYFLRPPQNLLGRCTTGNPLLQLIVRQLPSSRVQGADVGRPGDQLRLLLPLEEQPRQRGERRPAGRGGRRR